MFHFPRIHVYTPCWNEEALAPYYLRHYDFAEKIFIYDNLSDDRTAEILSADPRVTLTSVDTGGVFRESFLQSVKNEAWKQSRGQAEWVIVCDLDELVFHQNWSSFFTRLDEEGYNVVKAYGWSMGSSEFPADYSRRLTEQVRRGAPDRHYCKAALFRPSLESINYGPGCHSEFPRGENVKLLRSGALSLLHYRFLGWDYYWGKIQRAAVRIDRGETAQGLHYHLLYDEQRSRMEFDSKFLDQFDVLS